MEKLELEIVALSHSIAGSHSYAVVLGEVHGVRRLPIVIGGPEAQAIAVALEKMNPSRPLTHDLMRNIFLTYDIQLQEVVISNLKDGIFFAQLVCSRGGETIEIDSRTSDALALAVRFNCPIYTFEFILDQAGIVMEESQKEASETTNDDDEDDAVVSAAESIVSSSGKPGGNLATMDLEELKEMLNNLLANEDYETAAKVRDEIARRKEKES